MISSMTCNHQASILVNNQKRETWDWFFSKRGIWFTQWAKTNLIQRRSAHWNPRIGCCDEKHWEEDGDQAHCKILLSARCAVRRHWQERKISRSKIS